MPTDQPIRPEDIRPGDWIRYRNGLWSDDLAIVKRRVEYSDGSASDQFKVLGAPWVVSLSDVLEVRR